ncbi:HAD family hydrolase, partial [Candidatus Zixiibacteriota bacterium]
MDYKGVFFDFYGTLLIYHDTPAAWTDWLTACYENLQQGGLSISREEFAQHFDGLFSQPEPPGDNGDLTVYERRIKSMVTALLPEVKDRDIQRAATASASAWQKHITLDPETIPVLGLLKRSKTLALISNFDHPPHIHSLLDDLNLTDYFATVLISGETGHKKPHPYMFLQALEQTGLAPPEVIYVGDTGDDIQGARAAGIRPILIQRDGDDQSQMNADFKYRQPPEPHNDDG